MLDQNQITGPAGDLTGPGSHAGPQQHDAADAAGQASGFVIAASLLNSGTAMEYGNNPARRQQRGAAPGQQSPRFNAMLELAAITAHDLRNPLACIVCVLETLAEISKRNDVRGLDRIVDRGLRAAGRIEGMAERLLDSARGVADPVSRARCLVDDVVDAAVELNADAAGKKSVSLTVTGTGACVNADEGQLVEAIGNLISNAIKYANRGTTVRCDIKQKRGFAFIHVRDQGPGFSADDLARFGQPFQRLSARPTANETSTGLGLWAAIAIAERHGGALFVCSGGPDLGATLTLRLPLSA